MHFCILLLSLAASVVADGASILASLQQVDSDIATLNNTVVAFNGLLLQALPILGASTTLENDLKFGTKVAQASAPLSSDEALALIPAVDSLVTDTGITLNNAIAKEPEFKKLLLTGTIKQLLQTLQGDADAYSNAIIQKVPTDLQSTAQALVGPLDTSFDQAIAAYS